VTSVAKGETSATEAARKQECVWQHNFAGFIEARAAIAARIRW